VPIILSITVTFEHHLQVEIKAHPGSFEKLAGLIRRRLCPRPDIPHLSFEDQQMLVS